MAAPGIDPLPPVVAGVALPWDADVPDPVAALGKARREHGDTFVVDSGPDRYLFTFSPVGVASFYRLPEEQASKGIADWRMLRRKLPPEVFAGRRTFPHDLFSRADVATYLANLEAALDATVAELGDDGTLDVFTLTRRLGHRLGLASWAGPGCGEGERFDRLSTAFDALDGSDAFVHPDAMVAVAAAGFAPERRAIAVVADVVGAALDDLDAANVAAHPLFVRIAAAWDGEAPEVRRTGVALDVALLHVASMSNLLAALGWALVDLLEHPDDAARVAAGDREHAERCALESTRLAQRSIMSRYVLAAVELDVGGTVHAVSAGVTIATLLPLTNTGPAPGLDGWEPARWSRWRVVRPPLPVPELVTAFGHGKHTCPAQPFSLAAMVASLTRLLGRYELTAGWPDHPQPVAAQIGGVARPSGPCPAAYRRR
ncbi:MAG TPA: cytochrome [Mycobacteriales bacterium]|nr:cytochrome [Mycobacteriales bacterium]